MANHNAFLPNSIKGQESDMESYYAAHNDKHTYSIAWIQKEERVPPHFHNALEFVGVAVGCIDVMVDGRKRTIGEGEIMIAGSMVAALDPIVVSRKILLRAAAAGSRGRVELAPRRQNLFRHLDKGQSWYARAYGHRRSDQRIRAVREIQRGVGDRAAAHYLGR